MGSSLLPDVRSADAAGYAIPADAPEADGTVPARRRWRPRCCSGRSPITASSSGSIRKSAWSAQPT
jgi:hypothetical protein